MSDEQKRLDAALASASRLLSESRVEMAAREPTPTVTARRVVGEPGSLEALAALESVDKAEPPRGKLPALKVPDPEFLVDRLADGKTAGLLSRRRRVARLGDPQALVNELHVVEGLDDAFVWAVVSQGGPVPTKTIADLDESLRKGIDRFTLEEFSTERDVFYIPLRLLVHFDPPLKLKRPPAGRRFASTVDFARDIEKAALDPLAFANDPSTELLRALEADELLELRRALRAIYDAEFRGNKRTRARGVTREDVINAHAFILEEISRRDLREGPDDDEPFLLETMRFLSTAKASGNAEAAALESKFAPVHASGKADHADDPARIAEVLSALEKPMALRMPCVFLVGGVAEHGESPNDIDLLIRGPFDPDTEHVIKFRLGRALPPRLSQRVQFLTESTGPFTNHVPLFDLMLVPHESREIVEMRDTRFAEAVALQDDPLMDWPAKPGKRPWVFQYHFRGKSVHGDLRIAIDAKTLIGWTLAIQKAGKVPDVNTLEVARRIARDFSVEGSRENKPLVLPSRVFATPKARQPVVWMTMPDTVFPPGEVGATSEEQGVVVKVRNGKGCEWGMQKPHSHEYFFSGDPEFRGVLFFRLLQGGAGPGDESLHGMGETFWTAGFTKSLLPGVLKRRSVQNKTMPPVGQSAMPTTLMQATPREFRFWEADTPKEAREARDALVEARVFTESNVVLDSKNEFRVASQKVLSFAHDPADDEDVEKADSVPFTLSWQMWKGQTVVRAAPSRQVWHLFVAYRDGKRVTDWVLQRDPLSGEEAIAAQEREGGLELLKFEGDVEPGQAIGGLPMNETKATPSKITIQDSGKVELLDVQPTFKKLRFHGNKLRGIYTLVAEEAGGELWQFSPGADPGRAVPEAKQETIDEHAREIVADVLSDTSKAARVRADGTQVWDPSDVKDDDDKGGGRAELRPPALFRHMKPADRSNTVFNDPDEAAKMFLSDDERLVRQGVQVEPKLNGFSVVAERWDADIADEVKEGGVLVFTEDKQRELQDLLPGFAAELKAIGGNFVLDGEVMGVDDDGKFLPRRDLAQFRGEGKIDDANLRYLVFDALYLPSAGNITQKTTAERRRALERFWSTKVHGSKGRLVLVPKRIARTRSQLRDAIEWASKQPGSEGAMLKQVSATYSLGGENDLFGKVKLVREVNARVLERNSVKGSPGVYNFVCGVGPIAAGESEKFAETVEAGGKTWVHVGRTGNRKLAAKPGDTIRVEVLEILWEEGPPVRIRWFGPAQAIDTTDAKPDTPASVRRMLRPGEVKASEAADKLAKAERAVRILKADSKADTGGSKEERFVFGVVLVPDEVDAQGETYTAPEVRKAAHSFMELFGGQNKLMHQGRPVEGIKVLETYLTKQKEAHGGETFPVGTWLMAVRVLDDKIWAAVKDGTFTGFSIGGTALRERLR